MASTGRSTSSEEFRKNNPIDEKIIDGIPLSVKEIRSPEGLLLLTCWRRDGASLTDIAHRLGRTPKAVSDLRHRYPEIEKALAKGKEIVDYEVENALLKCALGYTTVSTKVIIKKEPGKDGNRVISKEKVVSEVGPNSTACLAWLNNKKPEEWKKNRDNQLEYEDKNKGITINIIKGEEQPTDTDIEEEDKE